MPSLPPKGFTLIELLIVIAIIAVLSVVVILSLNPAELLRQTRDSSRLSDMDTLNKALALLQLDGLSLGTANTVYVSVPDPTATSTLGDQCQGLGLPALPATYAYHCAASSTVKNVDGTGWIPVNLTLSSLGTPLGILPVDPQNTTSSRLYYAYTTNGSQFEVTAAMESIKFKLGGSGNVVSTDGGPLATVYEKGTKLGLEPLDYGDPSLAGLWTFDEGSGGTAYDYSGSNATGSLISSPTWVAGKINGAISLTSTGSSAQHVNVPSLASQMNSGADTLSAWVYLSNPAASSYQPVIGTCCTANQIHLSIENNGKPWIEVVDGSSNRYLTYGSPSVLSANTWYYLVGVYNGASGILTFYLNGTQSGQITSVPNNLVTNGFGTTLGNINDNSATMVLDDVRVYGRALSAAEIAALYSGGK